MRASPGVFSCVPRGRQRVEPAEHVEIEQLDLCHVDASQRRLGPRGRDAVGADGPCGEVAIRSWPRLALPGSTPRPRRPPRTGRLLRDAAPHVLPMTATLST